MSTSLQKLTRLRAFFRDAAVLKSAPSIDAYLLPSTDAHESEYLSEHDFRVKFLSGFSGSNAFTLITDSVALLWTDGRYFIQAQQQLGEGWTMMRLAEPDTVTPEDWLVQNLKRGSRVGFDPEIYGYSSAKELMSTMEKVGIQVVPILGNLVDPLWENRPPLADKKLIVLTNEETGESVESKITRIRSEIEKKQCDSIVLLSLDDVMWTLNIRGGDITYNPLAYSVLLITKNDVHLFINDAKLDDASRAHLSSVVIHPYEDAHQYLSTFSSSSSPMVYVPVSTNYAIASLFEKNSIIGTSPVQLMKGLKNDVELTGMRNASIRDSVALVKYFHWLEGHVTAGKPLTEEEAGRTVDDYRAKEDKFVDLSFSTISAVGGHAALPHYHPSGGSDRDSCDSSRVFLLDSGGHYRDGTTDVTRTVWYGSNVPKEFIRHNTLVLIAHIDLALTKFPKGINGIRLDMGARRRLWDEGLDYAHGVGHGVGHFLNVHEAPPSISYRKYMQECGIYPNQVVTIEPGYYLPNKWGIRIENVYEVIRADVPTTDEFLTFRSLTLVPIQKAIIDKTLLEQKHIDWLNEYHARVLYTVGLELEKRGDEAALAWLRAACSAI